MIIPWQQLSADALSGLIEEYVTREGTEYGETEVALDTKVAQVRRQLERDEVLLVFDPVTSTANLVHKRDWVEPGDDD
ncbi:YheU family protein [Marinimicrobium alkaliphilum]|uniref:YheU family protein n=1 Tax=Marinimicrobium alkaliphilum TaxID=2202654 RepID=UPI000DB9A111|nr:YheU family protein [Marinimicrobium alkaliphilum]